MKFGQSMDMEDPKSDLEGQVKGHQVKNRDFRPHLTLFLKCDAGGKGHVSSRCLVVFFAERVAVESKEEG